MIFSLSATLQTGLIVVRLKFRDSGKLDIIMLYTGNKMNTNQFISHSFYHNLTGAQRVKRWPAD